MRTERELLHQLPLLPDLLRDVCLKSAAEARELRVGTSALLESNRSWPARFRFKQCCAAVCASRCPCVPVPCTRTGLIARGAKIVERAWVRVAQEAVGPDGQVVP